eukprot:CAMPEP_0119322028 /NCGR_PEP_ID=MMETSP1333-20130426/57103_1 /TAXON_ID=418940 /ORGANISM="Scyphosphaera apsteinii, Strain RCC1455" /LENGTH=39 /DNA_ID= /DNA_START= /DNA_END= /DNA_ORIENTATION=
MDDAKRAEAESMVSALVEEEGEQLPLQGLPPPRGRAAGR